MMDNFVQVNVGNAADKVLPAVLANQADAIVGRLAEHGTSLEGNCRPPSAVQERLTRAADSALTPHLGPARGRVGSSPRKGHNQRDESSEAVQES
jgi:hypothetical protein